MKASDPVASHPGSTVPGRGKDQPPPRPPYLTDAWFREQGIPDPGVVLGTMRSEADLMRPEMLRAIKASRVSFAQSLIRRMLDGNWSIQRICCEIDRDGAGFVAYEIDAGGRILHFAVRSRKPDAYERVGRLNENLFDFYGALFNRPADLDRTRREMADLFDNLWQARTDATTIGWTFANRSNRFFDHVVASLEQGYQPDSKLLADGGGYLIRNAGWFGNGRQGTCAWASLDEGHPLAEPYHADLFALYLWRTVSCDVAEAAAKMRNPAAARLGRDLSRTIGIGNSSGFGMVATLVRWPAWLSSMMFVRELAVAYALTRDCVDHGKRARFMELVERAAHYYAHQPSNSTGGIVDPPVLGGQLHRIGVIAREFVETGMIAGKKPDRPWAEFSKQARSISDELAEQIHSLLIEVESRFSDAAATLVSIGMRIERSPKPDMSLGELRELIENRYDWALEIDFDGPHASTFFWYRSEENGEQRRGERDIDPGVENETFINVAGSVRSLYDEVITRDPEELVAYFLMAQPEFCHAVGRVQLAAVLPYSEIRANLIHRDFRPLDCIRFLLGTLGLEASHPSSTRWVRGVFMQGAPLPEELSESGASDWLFPSPIGSAIE